MALATGRRQEWLHRHPTPLRKVGVFQVANETPAERWTLVRGADIPATLRLTLYALNCYQGNGLAAFCKRAALADEVGVHVDGLSRKLQSLEKLGAIERIWTERRGRPSREYAINFQNLRAMQRATLTDSSECESRSLTETSESTLTNSSGPLLRQRQSHSCASVRPLPLIENSMNIQGKSKRGKSKEGASLRTYSKQTFSKPTLEQIKEYCSEQQQQQQPDFDAQAFLDYYESNGWRVGRNPMKDWRATVNNWIRRDKTKTQTTVRPQFQSFTERNAALANRRSTFNEDED